MPQALSKCSTVKTTYILALYPRKKRIFCYSIFYGQKRIGESLYFECCWLRQRPEQRGLEEFSFKKLLNGDCTVDLASCELLPDKCIARHVIRRQFFWQYRVITINACRFCRIYSVPSSFKPCSNKDINIVQFTAPSWHQIFFSQPMLPTPTAVHSKYENSTKETPSGWCCWRQTCGKTAGAES